MPDSMNHRLESRFPGQTSTISDCYDSTDDNTLMAESEEELKSLLMKVTDESENAGLKLN